MLAPDMRSVRDTSYSTFREHERKLRIESGNITYSPEIKCSRDDEQPNVKRSGVYDTQQ